MRCKFCGSTSIHAAEENKNFSYGKAAAGTVVFGPVGAVAGLSGKKIKGYRCAQCGSFMERPMDNITESLVNDAIYKAKSGDRFSMYEYYKQQYPNIESVTLNNTGSSEKTIDVHRNNSENIMSAQTADNEKAVLKREYTYGYWQPDSPIYVQKVLINTKNGEDLLSLKMINQANKTIRSLYLQVTVVDDAGDQIVTKKCVYQGVNTKVGEKFPEDRAFGLGTDLAYRVDLFLEKAVFDDDSVWRGNDDATLIKIEMPDEIDEKTFPRYKYLVKAYEELTGKTILKWLRFHKDKLLALPRYIPVKENDYWICTCGMPVQTGKKCPVCNCEYDELQRIMSQETLIEAQRKEVKDRAANRAQETSAKYNEILRTDELREQEIKENTYRKSLNDKNEGTIDSITKAIAGFGGLIGYKDSKDQIEACQKLLKEKKEEEERQAEIQRKEAEEKSKRNTKTAMIAAAIIAICLAGFFVATNVIIPNAKYNAAVKLMENGEYDAAIDAFEAMNGYKDSSNQITECKYRSAVELMDKEEYSEARREFQRLGEYKDSKERVSQCEELDKEKRYLDAVALMESGDYVEAYDALKKLYGYKDSSELADSIEHEYEKSEINAKNIGDTVYFGKYDYDPDTKAVDRISWIILAKENNKALLVSEYILDCIPFGSHTDDYDETNWESCTLRNWVNTDFYDEAFSEGEKSSIEETTLSTIAYDYDSGEQVADLETKDKVFIFSSNEADKYFKSQWDRECWSSKLAQGKGIVRDSYSNGCWWLRSPAKSRNFYPEFVHSNGEIDRIGVQVIADNLGVRPAIWVDLGSD